MNTFFSFLLVLAALGLMFAVVVMLGGAWGRARQAVSGLRGVRTRVVCPVTGELARVRVGLGDVGRERRLTVIRCEYYPGGEPRCDRACFPAIARSLEPVVL